MIQLTYSMMILIREAAVESKSRWVKIKFISLFFLFNNQYYLNIDWNLLNF